MGWRVDETAASGAHLSTLDEEGLARADGIAESLWQGDLIASGVAVVLESPESSSLKEAHELETVDDERIWAAAALRIDSGWAAIVSQTCDVVRRVQDVAHLQLMPIVSLAEDAWQASLNGRRGTLFSLPRTTDVPIDFPAIDCSISFPMSKAALANQKVLHASTPLDPASRILLSHWLMRRVGRHAFPDDLELHVLAALRNKITSAMGKNSPAGFLSSCLVGVWSSTEWGPAVSIIFVVDENRLSALAPTIDLDKAAGELLGPVRKGLGKAKISVQVTGTVRSLDAVSAATLLVEHRQIDLDPVPVGGFIAKDVIAGLPGALAGGTST